MTILLFSLFERFAVYDNEEGCARQQLKICPVIMRAIPAFCFGIQ